MARRTFSRFKYAEEFADECDRNGFAWKMWRDPDETVEEDGETFARAVYVVEFI
jgi:hypothetical protein